MSRWCWLGLLIVVFVGCAADEEPVSPSRSENGDAKKNSESRSNAENKTRTEAQSDDDDATRLATQHNDQSQSGGGAEELVAGFLPATGQPPNRGAGEVQKLWFRVTSTELGTISRNRVSQTPVVFSLDFRRFAYWTRSGGRYSVVIDGRKSTLKVDHFPGDTSFNMHGSEMGRIVFSRDGKHVAYEAADRTAKKQFIVLDGKKLTEHDLIVRNSLVFSPDGRSLAYSAENRLKQPGRTTSTRKQIICIRGARTLDIPVSRVATYPQSYSPAAYNLAFDPAGGRLAFVQHRIRRFSGKGLPMVAVKTFGVDAIPRAVSTYESEENIVRHLTFTPDGKHVVYAIKQGSEWRMTVDGKEGPGFAELAPPVISADGSRLLYAAKDGQVWTVQHDGYTGEEFADVDTRIALSQNGRQTAFLFREDRFKPWALARGGVVRQFRATVEREEQVKAFLQIARTEQKAIVYTVLKNAYNCDQLLQNPKQLMNLCVIELERRRQKSVMAGSLAMSPSGRYLAWRSSDGDVWINRWKLTSLPLFKGEPRMHFIDERHLVCVGLNNGRLTRISISVAAYPETEAGSPRWYPWPVAKNLPGIGTPEHRATVAELAPRVDPKQVAAQANAEKSLNGTWKLTAMHVGAPGNRGSGRKLPDEIWTFKNGRLTKTITRSRGSRKSTSNQISTYTINAQSDPVEIDIDDRNALFSGNFKGLYKIERNQLTMALSPGTRPTKLIDPNSRHRVYILERVTP